MKTLSILLSMAAFSMVSCDASEQASEQPIRAEIVAQCEDGAQGVGVTAERIPGVCDCSAEKMLEGGTEELANIDPAQLQEIVAQCIQESGTSDEPTAAEQING